jgi:hypothetical protein
VLPVPLKQRDHVEPRTVVHLATVLRAGSKCGKVLAIVANVSPRATSAVVRPRGRVAHVRKNLAPAEGGSKEKSGGAAFPAATPY